MAEPISPGGARVVDPIITGVARGYRNAAHVWNYLFPVVTVNARGGHIIEFNAEDFLEVDIRRSPGADRQQVHFGHFGASFSLDQRAIDGKVPKEVLEDAMAVPGINYSAVAAKKAMNIASLQIEIAAGKLATTPANYPADNRTAVSAADKWDGADAQPAKQVETAKEQVASGIGMEPNLLITGVPVHRSLKNSPDVIDRIKHTEGLSEGKAPQVTNEKLAAYFDVEMYAVGRARTGKKGAFTPIWGNVAILAYVDVTPLASIGSPSFGYTYRLSGYPIAEPGYYERSCESWLYPVTTEDTPVIAGADGGYLFTEVTSE